MGFCLSKEQRQAVIQLVLNHVGSVGQRQALVNNAWYEQKYLINDVNYDGGASQFATQLVDIAQGAEDLNGLFGLLDEVMTRVGLDKQKQIQQLKAEITAYNRNCPPESQTQAAPPPSKSNPVVHQTFNFNGDVKAGNFNTGTQTFNGDVHIDNSNHENNVNISGNNNQIGSISQGDGSESKGGIGDLFGWRKK
jgi:hypothetical protein